MNLQLGIRQPGEVSDLPAGLHGYYADQVRRWQQDQGWQQEVLPLLATLAVAEEALPASALARLAGGLDTASVRRWCGLALRPGMLDRLRPGSAGTATVPPSARTPLTTFCPTARGPWRGPAGRGRKPLRQDEHGADRQRVRVRKQHLGKIGRPGVIPGLPSSDG